MILDSFKLVGKVAIVTGASKGLGQSMAVALAEAGANIVGVSSSNSKETQKLVEATGKEYYPIQANLIETTHHNKIVDATISRFGKIDILVNNAGIIRRENLENFTEQDWDDVININLKMVFLLSQAVGKQFINQNTGGKIINIASMLSFQGGIRVPSYTASKSGIKGLTMSFANEWAKYNININAIAPGYMETDNTSLLRQDEYRSKEILSRIPAGRWGKPEDLAGAVVFLASDASNYINGYTIAVDGGWLAR